MMKQITDDEMKGKKSPGVLVLFTNDEKVVEGVRGDVVYSGGTEQDVVLVNEKLIVSKHSKQVAPPNSYETERPLTAVVGYN